MRARCLDTGRGKTLGRITVREKVLRIRDGAVSERVDTLVAEEPLEIRLNGDALTITMRTPGHDFDLAAGFLIGEGVVSRRRDVVAIRYCAGATEDGGNTFNVVDVSLAGDVPVPRSSLTRNFHTTSACGLCGKTSLDSVRTKAPWSVTEDPVRVSPTGLAALPTRLRRAQRIFDRTGGLHAAALFTPEGEPLVVREDVGRHNAVDKVIGWALRERELPLRGAVLSLSGRASFELVQKAWMAGIPVVTAVSAPSSLAVELAREAGITLVGFLRGASMNVYAGTHRVDSGTVPAPRALTPEG